MLCFDGFSLVLLYFHVVLFVFFSPWTGDHGGELACDTTADCNGRELRMGRGFGMFSFFCLGFSMVLVFFWVFQGFLRFSFGFSKVFYWGFPWAFRGLGWGEFWVFLGLSFFFFFFFKWLFNGFSHIFYFFNFFKCFFQGLFPRSCIFSF